MLYLLPNHKQIVTPFASTFNGVKTLRGKYLKTFETDFI